MDERVLGDVPSEGNESGRRFGIFRAQSPDSKLHTMCNLKIVFITAVAAVVTFSIFYPVMKYSSRANLRSGPFTYPKTINRNFSKNENPKVQNIVNCSTAVFSFGNDCTENLSGPTEDESNFFNTPTNILSTDVRRFDDVKLTEIEDGSLNFFSKIVEESDFKSERTGRSRRPVVSTPYPYYRLPADNKVEKEIPLSQKTNLFAIPFDLVNENYQGIPNTKLNFTPSPYAFTPFPNFTDSYAQLSPYRFPQNTTNLYEVMKYLKSGNASDRSFSVDRPEKDFNSRKTMMKVSGTYVMPLDRRRPGEIILSPSSDNLEEARPFFNGHAYVADPFNKFRPTNPSDVNRLIPIKSGMDSGPRFRKPVSFVPTSSVAVDLTQPSRSPLPSKDLHDSGSHTVAIFHSPTVGSQTPPLYLQPPTVAPRDKPLSVTLDIYPVTIDTDPDSTVGSSTPAVGERGRLNPKWRPKATERPRWRPQAHNRRPSFGPDQPPADNHMIVHLNLFPSRRKPLTFPRRNRGEGTRDTKSTILSGGQFLARSGSENPEAENDSEEENLETTTPPTDIPLNETSKSDDIPEYAFEKLEENKREEEERAEETITALPNETDLFEGDNEESNKNSSTLDNSESQADNDKQNRKLQSIVEYSDEETPSVVLKDQTSEEY